MADWMAQQPGGPGLDGAGPMAPLLQPAYGAAAFPFSASGGAPSSVPLSSHPYAPAQQPGMSPEQMLKLFGDMMVRQDAKFSDILTTVTGQLTAAQGNREAAESANAQAMIDAVAAQTDAVRSSQKFEMLKDAKRAELNLPTISVKADFPQFREILLFQAKQIGVKSAKFSADDRIRPSVRTYLVSQMPSLVPFLIEFEELVADAGTAGGSGATMSGFGGAMGQVVQNPTLSIPAVAREQAAERARASGKEEDKDVFEIDDLKYVRDSTSRLKIPMPPGDLVGGVNALSIEDKTKIATIATYMLGRVRDPAMQLLKGRVSSCPAEILKILSQEFTPSNPKEQSEAFATFSKYPYDISMVPSTYVGNLVAMAKEIPQLVPPQAARPQILNSIIVGLPGEFSDLKVDLETRRPDSLKEVQELLVAHRGRLMAAASNSKKSEAGGVHDPPAAAGGGSGAPPPSSVTRKEVVNIARAEMRKNNKSNNGGWGHSKGKGGQFWGSSGGQSSGFQGQCFKCWGWGHKKESCPEVGGSSSEGGQGLPTGQTSGYKGNKGKGKSEKGKNSKGKGKGKKNGQKGKWGKKGGGKEEEEG